MTDNSIDLNDGTHSRFDRDHYEHCDPCYQDHLDFMDEQALDARMDAVEAAAEFSDENEY
jgi:hypothetical protein